MATKGKLEQAQIRTKSSITCRGRKTNDSKQLELFAVTVVEYIEAECDVFLELTALL